MIICNINKSCSNDIVMVQRICTGEPLLIKNIFWNYFMVCFDKAVVLCKRIILTITNLLS